MRKPPDSRLPLRPDQAGPSFLTQWAPTGETHADLVEGGLRGFLPEAAQDLEGLIEPAGKGLCISRAQAVMKTTIVGSGIAGNVVAHYLRREHDISVFEAASHIGGHTHTHDVIVGERRLLRAPAGNWSFPTFALRIFLCVPGPLPRRLLCMYPFLPTRQRPSRR
jgi:hypothetical protein